MISVALLALGAPTATVDTKLNALETKVKSLQAAPTCEETCTARIQGVIDACGPLPYSTTNWLACVTGLEVASSQCLECPETFCASTYVEEGWGKCQGPLSMTARTESPGVNSICEFCAADSVTTPNVFSPPPGPPIASPPPTPSPPLDPPPPSMPALVHVMPGWCRQWDHPGGGARGGWVIPDPTEASCFAGCDALDECTQAVFESEGPWGPLCYLGQGDMTQTPTLVPGRNCHRAANRRVPPAPMCNDMCYNKAGWPIGPDTVVASPPAVVASPPSVAPVVVVSPPSVAPVVVASPPPPVPVASPPPPMSDAVAQCYVARYPDLRAAWGCTGPDCTPNVLNIARQHYTDNGAREGRSLTCACEMCAPQGCVAACQAAFSRPGGQCAAPLSANPGACCACP